MQEVLQELATIRPAQFKQAAPDGFQALLK